MHRSFILLNFLLAAIHTSVYSSEHGPRTLQNIAIKKLSKIFKESCNKISCDDPNNFLENFASTFISIDVSSQLQFLIHKNLWPALAPLLLENKTLKEFVNNPKNTEFNQAITKVIKSSSYQDINYQIIPGSVTNKFSIPVPQVKPKVQHAKSVGGYIPSKNIAVVAEFDYLNYIGFYKINFLGEEPHLLYQDTLPTFTPPIRNVIDKKSIVIADGQGKLVIYNINRDKISKDGQTNLGRLIFDEPSMLKLTPSLLIVSDDEDALFFARNEETGVINVKKALYNLRYEIDSPDYIFITEDNQFIIFFSVEISTLHPRQKVDLQILKVGPTKSITSSHTVSTTIATQDIPRLRNDPTVLNKYIPSALKIKIKKEVSGIFPMKNISSSFDNLTQQLVTTAQFKSKYPLNSSRIVLGLKLGSTLTFFDIIKDLLKKYESN